MSTTVQLTMSDLIDETLDYVHQYKERPAPVTMGSNALSSTSDNQFTLTTDLTVSVSDVLEFADELVLVTGKSTDASPVYTVSRGYLGTTPRSSVATGDTGYLNPDFPRYQVQRAIVRAFQPLNRHLPNIVSELHLRETDKQYVVVDSDTVRVLEVGFMNATTAKYTPIGGWVFVEDLPMGVVLDGKILRVPSWVPNDLELIVKRQVPYAWSTDPVTETSTIDVPFGSEDLPVLFAAARLVTGREISRIELDRVDEWNHEAAVRGGVNIRMMQMLWSDFYRRVEEARSLQNAPKHRPFQKMMTARQPRFVRLV